MCSIYGAIGSRIDLDTLASIAERAKDRGRDGGRSEQFNLSGGQVAIVGNWRAAPTTELHWSAFQPYDGIVHNGTIANDKELGNAEGNIDSMVLPLVIDRTDVDSVAQSLSDKIVGSYAIACVTPDTVVLACNYKPIYYWQNEEAVYFSSMARHFDSVLPFGQAPVKLEPYTAVDLLTGRKAAIRRRSIRRALVIASAGLDSTVAATKLIADGWDVTLLHYTYGCRAQGKEVSSIMSIADALGCTVQFVNIPSELLGNASPLLNDTSDIAGGIAGAEFAHEWVPARNLVMIAMATAIAEAHGYGAVVLGNNLEESGAYPDNEEEFTNLLNQALNYAVADGNLVQVLAPVGNLMKHEIVKLGLELGAPMHLTWSCYHGGDKHCGHCGPCFMRRTAFERNGHTDPVFTQDTQ